MNLVVLAGRLTRDPDVRYTDNQKGIARYALAVDRGVRKTDNTQTVDFINCVCFDRNAEFAEKYLKKGVKVLVEGRIQTGTYTNREGQKVSTFDVVVSRHEFCAPKSETNSQPEKRDEFVPIPDGVDDVGLPFN